MSRWKSICRGAGRPVGAVVMSVGVAMAVCGVVGLGSAIFSNTGNVSDNVRNTIALEISAAVALLAGALFRWFGRGDQATSLSRREAVFAVAVIWIASCLFGALPYMLTARLSPIDGLFESVSGLTTTGATVIQDVQATLCRPLLLWRAVAQWLGGMGIVVLFVAVFPNVGVGAKIMFHGEVPGAVTQGLQPRIADTSSFLWRAYTLLTLLLFALLWSLGMSPFDALCHAMTTVSTGGHSTRNGSIAAFGGPAIEVITVGFMLLSGINFGLYYAAINGRTLRGFLRSTELRVFALIVVSATLLLTASITRMHGSVITAFRHAVFQVVSFATSTGFETDSYTQYPSFGLMVLIALMLVGGCSGSTSGGIKVERVILLAKMGLAQIRATFRPNVVQVIQIDRKRINTAVLSDVAAFAAVYVACLATCALTITAIDGISAPVSFGAALSCLSNMGPLPFQDGISSFASFSIPSKLLLSVAMILGRLEFFTIFALFVPDFWRR